MKVVKREYTLCSIRGLKELYLWFCVYEAVRGSWEVCVCVCQNILVLAKYTTTHTFTITSDHAGSKATPYGKVCCIVY